MSDGRAVTNRAVAYIQQNISNGTWPVGSKIPSENQLCALLGASRTSVRSALQQFIAIGAVESIHGKGTFVRSKDLGPLSPMDDVPLSQLKDALQLCSLVQPSLYVQAMKATDPQLVPDLQEIMAQMLTLHCDQFPELFDLVGRFQQRVFSVFQNESLEQFRRRFSSILYDSPSLKTDSALFHGILYYFTTILQAFEHQDAERLDLAVRNYYTNLLLFYRLPEPESDAPAE